MIHRTGAGAARSIKADGLDTGIEKYGTLSSVATEHAGVDVSFRENLARTHNGSTHHFVFLIPDSALEVLRDRVEGRARIPRNKRPDALAVALGGKLPVEWALGYWHIRSGRFVVNPRFDPLHHPNLSGLNEVVREYTPRRR